MRVPLWWSIGGVTVALAGGGAHTPLCERPLVVRSSFTMSICSGKGGSDGRRNNGGKDDGNYREGQRIAMKNGTEWRFISRDKHSDCLLYASRSWCRWHWEGR